MALVRADDARHELVADDVPLVEVDEGDALDPVEHPARDEQAGRLAGAEVVGSLLRGAT